LNLGRFILAFVPLLWSCSGSTKGPEPNAAYFNNPQFIEETAKKLSTGNISFKKLLKTGGKEEQRFIPKPNWSEEFALLAKTNLNAPAFKGLFKIDSIAAPNGYAIVYTAMRDNMPTRKFVRTCTSDGTTQAVQCLQQENSLITQQTIEWRLVPDSGFYYKGSDRIRGVNTLSYSLGGQFIHP
jgi:hypothetical protein